MAHNCTIDTSQDKSTELTTSIWKHELNTALHNLIDAFCFCFCLFGNIISYVPWNIRSCFIAKGNFISLTHLRSLLFLTWRKETNHTVYKLQCMTGVEKNPASPGILPLLPLEANILVDCKETRCCSVSIISKVYFSRIDLELWRTLDTLFFPVLTDDQELVLWCHQYTMIASACTDSTRARG